MSGFAPERFCVCNVGGGADVCGRAVLRRSGFLSGVGQERLPVRWVCVLNMGGFGTAFRRNRVGRMGVTGGQFRPCSKRRCAG